MLSACAGGAEESGFSVFERKALSFQTYQGLPVYEGDDPNAKFDGRLLPNELLFDKVIRGQEILLNSLIVMPYFQEEGLLSIEFQRSDLQSIFIGDLFYGENDQVVNRHPFAQAGIEPILTDERFILNIYAGAILHLRNSIESSPDYQTFINENVIGKVTKIEGNVYYSSDHEYIKIKLHGYYTSVSTYLEIDSIDPDYVERRPDGSYVITAPLDAYEFPVRYPPRIIEGP